MKIYPFNGIRPRNDCAGHLITRPYKDYGPSELKGQLNFNPYSFLQILNPGYRYHQNIKGESKFKLVRNRYTEFKEKNFLIEDEAPSFYIYRKTTEERSYTGIIVNVSTEDYKNDIIKKHESTIQSRVNLFTDYLRAVGFNAEPVLMTYEDQDDINSLIDEVVEEQPIQRFRTTNMILHELWTINDEQVMKKLQGLFDSVPHIYIADGHHRSASSALLSDQQGQDNPSCNRFMSFIVPQSQLQIEMFARMIKGLNGYNPESFLLELDNYYNIESLGLHAQAPTKGTQVLMYLSGSFYNLTLRNSGYDTSSILNKLNTQILYHTILAPILGIKDLRKDQRISYKVDSLDFMMIKNLVDKGDYDIGFSLKPLSVNHIKDIADANLVMSPKSTCVYPKLYSGLVIYEFGHS